MFSYKKLEELLCKNDTTAYRVAKETGLYPTLFSDWKSGKSCPKADKIKKLADYFGVSIEYFLKEQEVREMMWRFKEFAAEYLVPAAMGVIGAFIGIGLAHWLGIM